MPVRQKKAKESKSKKKTAAKKKAGDKKKVAEKKVADKKKIADKKKTAGKRPVTVNIRKRKPGGRSAIEETRDPLSTYIRTPTEAPEIYIDDAEDEACEDTGPGTHGSGEGAPDTHGPGGGEP